eukprot:jgi/Undpi1/9580/HiC_scaffold_27.g12036.m1
MASQKRSRTDGHLSKEQYNDGFSRSALSSTQGFSSYSGGVTTGIQVADEDTLTARRLARSGDTKMRLLNRKFHEAVTGLLAQDPQSDLTYMIADYISYSTRIRRSFLADPGQVYMCGNGDCGQLGFGTEEFSDMEIKAPRPLPTLSRQKVITVACGGISTMALTESGRVFTWGSSDDGGIGRPGGDDAPEQLPGQVTTGLEGTTIIGIASGDCQMLALDLSGKVYGWGCYKDKEGKQWFQAPLGQEAKACKGAAKSPVMISGLPPDVVEVKCGASFCLALTAKGEVFSWGIGEIGELARDVCPMKFPAVPGSDDEPAYDFEGIRRDHITPGGMYRATGQDGLVGARMEGVKAIGCGEYHLLVVTRADADLYACGLNSYGQLGLGHTDNKTRLEVVEDLREFRVMATAGGAQHSLVLTNDGVFSFGRNDSGQLGCTAKVSKDDWGSSENTPMEVFLPPDSGNPVKVDCGTNHCLVITDKHELYTWGFGEACALGHGNDTDYSLPKKVNTKKRGIAKGASRAVAAVAAASASAVLSFSSAAKQVGDVEGGTGGTYGGRRG